MPRILVEMSGFGMKNQVVAKELEHFLDAQERLKQYPVKRRKQIAALLYLASKLEPNRGYTEKEINDALRRWHAFDDWALLRRDLCDLKLLYRTPDGAQYRLADEPLGVAVLGLEPPEVG